VKIDRFQMERTQCLYENEVKFNLSEKGLRRIESVADDLRDQKAARF